MNFQTALETEISSVFLNLAEFASEHEINGQKVACICDDQNGLAQTRSAADFSNVSGIGIIACDRLVIYQACTLTPDPLPGEKITMDGSDWYVAESGVGQCEGLYCLPLMRAF